MTPKVSIIVPVYNTKAWLIERSLKSICAQKKDIEIIVVDDGSVANDTINYLDGLKGTFQCVLVRKENGGLGSARNEGLKYATGEYVGFMDSDDYVDEYFYQKLYKIAKTNDADIVSGMLVATDGKKFLPLDSCDNLITANLLDKIKQIKHGSVCNKIFKRTLFEDITFPENKVFWEDNIALIELYIKSKILVFTQLVTYFYWDNSTSITKNNKYFTKRMNDSLIILKMIKELSFSVNDIERNSIVTTFLPILYTHKYYRTSKYYREQIHSMFTIDELRCIPIKTKKILAISSIALLKLTPIEGVDYEVCDVIRNNKVLGAFRVKGRVFCLIKEL